MTEPAIAVKDLQHAYGDHKAVQGISESLAEKIYGHFHENG